MVDEIDASNPTENNFIGPMAQRRDILDDAK
jgi:hypothetical protein